MPSGRTPTCDNSLLRFHGSKRVLLADPAEGDSPDPARTSSPDKPAEARRAIKLVLPARVFDALVAMKDERGCTLSEIIAEALAQKFRRGQ